MCVFVCVRLCVHRRGSIKGEEKIMLYWWLIVYQEISSILNLNFKQTSKFVIPNSSFLSTPTMEAGSMISNRKGIWSFHLLPNLVPESGHPSIGSEGYSVQRSALHWRVVLQIFTCKSSPCPQNQTNIGEEFWESHFFSASISSSSEWGVSVRPCIRILGSWLTWQRNGQR